MVISNKILTVSYGTFSCTLEGFDDPFTTLQMVAEYFRKLAAEDRYFGGVPRKPDTETLKEIARSATSRGVDADVGDDGIVLRQSNAPAPDSTEIDTAMAAAGLSDSASTFFRSRRPAAETLEAKPVAPAAKPAPVAVQEKPRAVATPAPAKTEKPAAKPDLKQSVAATLAAIRHNVEHAETAEARADDSDDLDFDDDVDLLEDSADSAPLVLGKAQPPEPASANIFEEEEAEEDTAAIASEEPETAELEDEQVAAPETAELPEEGTAAADDAAEGAPVAAVADPMDTAFEDPFFENGNADNVQTRDAIAAAVSGSSLTAEQEAELARDLEAAMLETEDEPEQVDPAAAQRREDRRTRAEVLRGNDDLAREEKALERLLVTTQSKMEKPDQQRRLNALDQLKAAVAATEAENKVNKIAAAKGHVEVDEDEQEMAAYRDDLRRAQAGARPSGRSGAAGLRAAPPPLILVSEQRIAPASEEPSAPSHEPRREVAESDGNLALKRAIEADEDHNDHHRVAGQVRGIPADAFSEATTFNDFAERIGAVDMVDLLEAAAAYTSIVEGQSRFSRAQVMSKIAKITPGDAFSKEAGLRAFGKLLREGKILRVQDGQFAISKASRFSIASRLED